MYRMETEIMNATTKRSTVQPVCNDHIYCKIYYLLLIQQCVLMKTEGTNLLLLTMSAFWSPSRWPLASPEGREVSHQVVAEDRFHHTTTT